MDWVICTRNRRLGRTLFTTTTAEVNGCGLAASATSGYMVERSTHLQDEGLWLGVGSGRKMPRCYRSNHLQRCITGVMKCIYIIFVELQLGASFIRSFDLIPRP